MPDRLPVLKRQEIPLDAPDSSNMFEPSSEKPFVATPAAIEAYTQEVIFQCLIVLNEKAKEHEGLDYLQVFESAGTQRPNLWFIEDGEGGAITALLPSDY